MKMKKFLALLLFPSLLFLLLLLPHNTSGGDGSKDGPKIAEDSAKTAENGVKTAEGVSRADTDNSAKKPEDELDMDKCFDIQDYEDTFLLTRIGGDSCMLIGKEEHIPSDMMGNKTYEEDCETFIPAVEPDSTTNATVQCKLYVNITTKVNETYEHVCVKPTHLTCDPVKKKCVCSDDGIVVSDIRFQFGTTDVAHSGENRAHGWCLIRPTFDVMPGFDCSPNTKREPVTSGDDDKVTICSCGDKTFITNQTRWWQCSQGPRIVMQKEGSDGDDKQKDHPRASFAAAAPGLDSYASIASANMSDIPRNLNNVSAFTNPRPIQSGSLTKAGSGASSPSTTRKKRVTLLTNEVDVASLASKTSSKQQIFGGTWYSRAMLRGSRSTGETTLNETLRFLEGTQHLLFRKCKTFPPELSSFQPKNKRGIWNSSGRVVYYTGEKSSYYCKCCLFSGFIHEVVDYTGKFVIISKGRQMIFGINSVEIFLEDGKLLGSMYQSCLNSTYIIRDGSGRIIYKIQAPCFAPCAPFVFWCCKEHFEICMDDGVTEIGKITKYWGGDIAVQEFQCCLGLQMDSVDDVRVKSLLLGCFFLIEFQYYRGGGNGPIYFVLMLLLFALIFVAFECAGYCPFWKGTITLYHLDQIV